MEFASKVIINIYWQEIYIDNAILIELLISNFTGGLQMKPNCISYLESNSKLHVMYSPKFIKENMY